MNHIARFVLRRVNDNGCSLTLSAYYIYNSYYAPLELKKTCKRLNILIVE